jgi:hypothetical protein
LGLDYWDVTHCWHRGPIDDCEETNDRALARCATNWQYLYAVFHWNLPLVQDENDKGLETIFVHECMHVFLHELRHETDDWLDHEERVAQMLAKAIIWVRNSEREALKPTVTLSV